MKAGRLAKGAITALLRAPAVAEMSGTSHAESAAVGWIPDGSSTETSERC